MSSQQKIILISLSLFGLFVPNGMFFLYLFTQFRSFVEVLNDLLALGFIIDAAMATGMLAWWFAKHPAGKYTWKLFVGLSLLGGLGFSLPFFYYLNAKEHH